MIVLSCMVGVCARIAAEVLIGTQKVTSELKAVLLSVTGPILRGLETNCGLVEGSLSMSTSDSKVNFIRYKPGGLWGEFHWDHLNSQFGLLCLQAPEEGGSTFMDVGRSRFTLQSGQAAAWIHYDKDGTLICEVSFLMNKICDHESITALHM